MKNIALIVALALALGACGSKPAQPSWKANAAGSLTAFSDAYLKGDTGIADTEFARARGEMASTGRPDLVAHAELYRCATRVASLEYDNCPGFAAVAQDASAAEHAYAAYLDGRWQGLDAQLLPEQQRAIVQGKATLAAIADPLSRLVAAGVLMKTQRIAPADIAVATSTASEQGWRRPLLMWLGVSLKRVQAAGDNAEAARIQRRIELAAPKNPGE
ncbi:MAG: hypothetical protein V4631_14330 [Pseudomonadota bacterium]